MTRTQSPGWWKEPLRLTLTLLIITTVVAGLLAGVNAITQERIAADRQAKTDAAMRQVLQADDYELVPTEAADVTAVYRAETQGATVGYVVMVSPAGFGGPIDLVVGVQPDGTVTGVAIVSMSETPSLGDRAKDEDFLAQFVGSTGQAAVTKDGGTVDALTGATVTSRAVATGVNQAVAAVQAMP